MVPKYTECNGVDLVYLSQDKMQFQVLVCTVLNICI
jgi:hypothetical protein